MPSFDIVLEPNLVELRNAVDQTKKEIATRFDFKGTSANVDLEDTGSAKSLVLHADSDFQIGQVKDVLWGKLAKRGVDARFFDDSAKIERVGGDKVRQPIAVKEGIDSVLGKKIQTLVKQSKIKVQAALQGTTVRVTGAKRDDLQMAIALLKREVSDAPLKFDNFRD
jgi:uncharacterized protein YajQ (UPF0234 family)